MATISIYAGKINQMPDMVKNARSAVNSLKTELAALKNKTLSVDSSICNLDDVISSISATVQTQENKADTLEAFQEKSEVFIEDTVRIDDDVADRVNQHKDDFYDKYYYLKPECEKSGWEKFCDRCKSVVDWCKEHWVLVTTAVVVVVIAIVAACCGVAVAAIAAIAGLVALVLFAADVICMLATGGKSIADICNENGLWWLGEIFSGLSVGCDLVAILLPVGAAIKTISKIGLRSFGKGVIASMKVAFKETCEAVWTNGFKQGFGKGLKSIGKGLLKTFIFDIDDISKVDNGKRVWDLMEATPLDRKPSTKSSSLWKEIDGKYYPSDTAIPGDKHYNPDGLTMKELFEQTCSKIGIDIDAIPIGKDGRPDFSVVSVADSKINMKNLNIDIEGFLNNTVEDKKFRKSIRDINYKNASANLPGDLTYDKLQAQFDIKLTPHELFNMKTVQYVPEAIHAPLAHLGGVGREIFMLQQIPRQIDTIIRNIVGRGPIFVYNWYQLSH